MSMLFAISLSLLALVQGQTAPSPEVVYLLNCIDTDIPDSTTMYWSEMGYYPDANNVGSTIYQTGKVTTSGTYVDWEAGTQDNPVTGTFASGTVFSVWGLDNTVSVGSQTGQGSNGYTSFSCFREAGQSMVGFTVSTGSFSCNAVYSCGHTNPTVNEHVLSYNVTLNPNIVSVTNPSVDAATALGNFNSDVDGSSCTGNSYSIGDGCSIQFTQCILPAGDQTALNNYLVNVVAPQIPSSQVTTNQYVPSQCSVYICSKFGIGEGCACSPTPVTDTVQSWPSRGDINIWSASIDNPTSLSLQAWVEFEVTCAAPSSCNAGICGTIAGGISAAGAFTEDIPLSVFGSLLGIGCGFC